MSSTEHKLEERLKDLIKYPLTKDVSEALGRELERTKKAKGFKKEVVENVLKNLGFWKKLSKHPIVGKSIEWGNPSKQCKRQPEYKELSKKIIEIMERQKLIPTDCKDITELLKKLIDIMINSLIHWMGESEKGLRPPHAPGSVTKDEARNLYFGERYDDKNLFNMVLRLCNSFPIGNDIGIYFEDEELRRELMQRFEKGYGSRIELPLEELKISRYERQKPYVVFMKFLLWLYREYDEAEPEEKISLKILLDHLKNASATIYFTPGREKEKWCMISVPRIDWFASRWLEDKEQKTKLEELGETLNNFTNGLIKKAGRQRRGAKNIIELIMHNYELLSQQLLVFGMVDYTSLRNIVNLVTELAIRYDVKTSMNYCKWLT